VTKCEDQPGTPVRVDPKRKGDGLVVVASIIGRIFPLECRQAACSCEMATAWLRFWRGHAGHRQPEAFGFSLPSSAERIALSLA
jgi:hypothetical protein